MIKAVIFDMFETLVTHYKRPLYMGKQIAAHMGVPEKKFREIWDTTEVDRTLGRITFEAVIDEILTVNQCASPQLFEEIVRERVQSKEDCFRLLHPQILPMLEALRVKGQKIGLITNCYFEERDVIRNSVMMPYFDVACMSCELGLKKPDPAIFERCVEELGVQPEECLYVGDGGSQELEAAQRMGMKPVQALWYLAESPEHPSKRKEAFDGAETPLAVLQMIR